MLGGREDTCFAFRIVGRLALGWCGELEGECLRGACQARFVDC